MRRLTFIYISILASILSSSIISAQNKEGTSIIPYELIKGKMIVKMEINGSVEKFIFDTGAATSSLEPSFCRAHNMAIVDSMNIRDASNLLSNYRQVVIQSLRTPDRMFNFKYIKAILHPENSIFGCFDGVIGLIGSDILQNLICTIDSKQALISLTNSTKPLNESLRYAHNFTAKSILPILAMQINGEIVSNCLFDTGAGGFLSLKKEVFNELNTKNALSTQRVGYGASHVGLSGIMEVDTSLLVKMENIRIGPFKIKSAYAETANVPYTLIGTTILNYCKVVIDYQRRRIYFLPYSEEAVAIPSRFADIGISIKDGNLIISNVWDSCKSAVNPGDIITHVNGEPIGKYDMCDIIRGVALLNGNDSKVLKVLTKDGTTKDVVYEFKDF